MSKVKLNLIAAACENMGIGVNGTLPWRLNTLNQQFLPLNCWEKVMEGLHFRKEMAYFTSMTTKVSDPGKKNAVIMGRVTWDCIPDKYRPLAGRVNIVLTHNVDQIKKKVPEGVLVVPSLDEAISVIESRSDIGSAWVIGGSAVYKAAMLHPNCGKVYLTEIQKSFECDTFFPDIDKDMFHLVNEDDVPGDEQIEGDVRYFYRVYEKL